MIMDLNDTKHLWKIVVRITEIWYVQIPPKPGHVEMVLMDSKGDKIQVSVRNEEFNEWKERLVENKTYVMHNYNVFRNELQFKEGEDESKAYPLSFDFLLAKTIAIRVKVQASYNQSSAIRLSEDPNLIKTILDTIGISISITADHDPDHIQVVTPAKRLSPDFDIDLLQSPIQNSTQLSSSKVAKHIKT
ncbi:hypothetical protein Lal_00026848 [Lupinus albus]|nr:hypothetical protein Lal_00026848 [Lupinus albus]